MVSPSPGANLKLDSSSQAVSGMSIFEPDAVNCRIPLQWPCVGRSLPLLDHSSARSAYSLPVAVASRTVCLRESMYLYHVCMPVSIESRLGMLTLVRWCR